MSADRVLRPSAAAGPAADGILDHCCERWPPQLLLQPAGASPTTAAASGRAGLLQPHRAGRAQDAPETGVLAVDRQQPPSRWMCRRRIRRPASCARPRAAAAAALADSTRVVVEAAAPLWSPRARSGEVARSGERGGEGPWHASRAARGLLQVLGWPKLLRFPRWVLADLSKKRHASFYHIFKQAPDSLNRWTNSVRR